MHQGAPCASCAQEIGDKVKHLGVEDGRRREILPRCRGTGQNKDSRADDRTNSQGGQRPRTERLLEPVRGLVGFGNQLVDGLTTQQLISSRRRLRFS